MNIPERPPRIGEIYCVKFNGKGSEQNGLRPGLVVQNNTGNTFSPNVIVLPLTSSLKKLNQPTHVLLRAQDTGLIRDSLVLCENPECVSKERLGNYITTLSDKYMQKIATAFLLATSVFSYIDYDALQKLWKKAVSLNY